MTNTVLFEPFSVSSRPTQADSESAQRWNETRHAHPPSDAAIEEIRKRAALADDGIPPTAKVSDWPLAK